MKKPLNAKSIYIIAKSHLFLLKSKQSLKQRSLQNQQTSGHQNKRLVALHVCKVNIWASEVNIWACLLDKTRARAAVI